MIHIMKFIGVIGFVLLVGQLLAAELDMDEITKKCFVPCSKVNNTCVSHSCYRSRMTTVCNIYSSYAAQSDIYARSCVAPKDVQGLGDFCRNVLAKEMSPGAENIQTEQTTIDSDRTAPAKNVSYLEDQCLSTTALASVASGSFAAGCFVMWLIMSLLRCIDPCKADKANESYMEISATPESQMSLPSSRASRSRPTDLRHQGSSASVDSGMSSPQVTTPTHVTQGPRRPTVNAPKPPVPCGATGDNLNAYPPAQFEGVYAPGSECSNRDYQSIQGSVYAPSSEGGNSDYSGHPTHRVLFIRENGEIYQPSSESSGNDYTSLNGYHGNGNHSNTHHGNNTGGGIYYPTSDSSCKGDYSSLLDEGDLGMGGYCDVDDMIVDTGNHDNVKFRVSGFVIPKQKLSTKGRPAPALGKVNEHEAITCQGEPTMADEYSRPADAIPGSSLALLPGIASASGAMGMHTFASESALANRRLPMDGFHLSELRRASLRSKPSLPHNYLVLEAERDI